jgi:hypothetical protein
MVTEQQAPVKKSNRRVLLIGCGLILACAVLGCGAFAYMVSQASGQFEEALAAMSSGDCDTAVPLFTELLDNPFATEEDVKNPAQEHLTTCNQFTQLVEQQNSGDLAGAIIGYEEMVTERSSSPLLLTIENQAKTVFTAEPAQIANPTTCTRLDGFIERNWIANLDDTLPGLYQACGQAFTAVGDYTNAVIIYQRFVTAYPDHPVYNDVETALAKASVAEARAAGAGEIAAPLATGAGDGSGPAIVIIQNDSREQISLVFSGPEARFESLSVCEECEDYVGTGPEFCPEIGPIGTYELPAGTYEVVVKSFSDEGVIPFTGTWDLAAGEEYYSCFFLITESE